MLRNEACQFRDPSNAAFIANRKIIFERAWISYVSHNNDDGVWQFHIDQSGPITESDAVVVGLKKILDLDSKVLYLSDLQKGGTLGEIILPSLGGKQK
ncbi:hypothetical protein [Ralstonia pseudosolanacearum]|uniref:hypothetical protein n=1 Tax=Ralstonia pseudosolanacearum TaxID=1310165 RepID=UPI001FF75534|nr:hypothetical protein [Ralstonia pseudosolanacearum]